MNKIEEDMDEKSFAGKTLDNLEILCKCVTAPFEELPDLKNYPFE